MDLRARARVMGWGFRAYILGVVLPALTTLLAAIPTRISTATAALAYVLAVTAAAVFGGLAAGLVASVVSFVALNFFFTPPVHTLVVGKPEDLVALVVFLLVSLTVGSLISTALEQRAQAVALGAERTRLDAEARIAREEAETSKLRAALFSSVTHDLRTPLASITASVTSLLAEEVASFSPGDRRELLDTIRHEADRLNRAISNLLDLSRMRAGVLVPSKVNASVDELLDAVLVRLEPALRGHELDVSLPDDLPEVVVDVAQIDQVFTNVVENAARFTPTGRHIAVSASANVGTVRIRVADEGVGLPDKERKRVFEPFVRGEGSPGSGLGLSIARAIVEAHGGNVWIDDGLAGGIAVVIDLPVGR